MLLVGIPDKLSTKQLALCGAESSEDGHELVVAVAAGEQPHVRRGQRVEEVERLRLPGIPHGADGVHEGDEEGEPEAGRQREEARRPGRGKL